MHWHIPIAYSTKSLRRLWTAPTMRPTAVGPFANRSLLNIEPVSATPKRKLKNGAQRPAPETRPSRTETPEIADQRLGRPGLTRGNVADSHTPGNNTPETSRRDFHRFGGAPARRADGRRRSPELQECPSRRGSAGWPDGRGERRCLIGKAQERRIMSSATGDRQRRPNLRLAKAAIRRDAQKAAGR